MKKENDVFLPIAVASILISLVAFGFAVWSIKRVPSTPNDTNELALVLTTVEILLVLFAFFGFWVYKGVVEQQASRVAELEATREAGEQLCS